MPGEEASLEIRNDLSMERLDNEFENLSLESKAHVALVHLRSPEGKQELIDQAIDDWTSNLRVGGRTAYIAACNGCAAPMSKFLVII